MLDNVFSNPLDDMIIKQGRTVTNHGIAQLQAAGQGISSVIGIFSPIIWSWMFEYFARQPQSSTVYALRTTLVQAAIVTMNVENQSDWNSLKLRFRYMMLGQFGCTVSWSWDPVGTSSSLGSAGCLQRTSSSQCALSLSVCLFVCSCLSVCLCASLYVYIGCERARMRVLHIYLSAQVRMLWNRRPGSVYCRLGRCRRDQAPVRLGRC